MVKSGDEANSFYHDAHNLAGCCDYVMANPPFNVDKVKAESAQSAGRLPFGLPAINKAKEFGNANYLWISYFYDYLNENGRAGFVMASTATDSQGKDKDIREKLVQTGHVDVMISVGNNFFYTKSLPCTLWFFDKGKAEALRDKVLFIDARNYYTVADRTLNEWSEWQLRNMNAIVWLYRGEQEAYQSLLGEYHAAITEGLSGIRRIEHHFMQKLSGEHTETIRQAAQAVQAEAETPMEKLNQLEQQLTGLKSTISETVQSVIAYYASMSKSNYKVLQQQFKQKHGFALEGLPAVKKMLNAAVEAATAEVDELLTVLREARWLYEKFGEGEYQDVPGLCKIASRREIEGKGYSLTPGAYVGVAAQEDDGVDFGKRMKEIHAELLNLQEESNRLMETISKNMEEMGL